LDTANLFGISIPVLATPSLSNADIAAVNSI